MSSTPRSCQGCGLTEGEPRVTWHSRRNKVTRGWDRIKRVGPICVLMPLDLGGLGERLFCPTCWPLAALENARLQHPLLGGKRKVAPPDPRQIRML